MFLEILDKKIGKSSIMSNIHQIHDTIRNSKCKYFSIEKQNRLRRKFLFSAGGLLLKLLQLSLFGEQVADQFGGADAEKTGRRRLRLMVRIRRKFRGDVSPWISYVRFCRNILKTTQSRNSVRFVYPIRPGIGKSG